MQSQGKSDFSQEKLFAISDLVLVAVLFGGLEKEKTFVM